MRDIKIVNEDPFYSEVQDGKVDVKCSRLLENALRAAAPQLKIKYPELVRSILRQALIGLAMEGKIQLPDMEEMKTKAASGE